MEAAGLSPNYKQGGPVGSPGELILQNGRQSGTKRPLGLPLTFIGKSATCDIRLNIEGIAPLHCLVGAGPDGIWVRDLDTGNGTYVNGQRVSHVAMRDGDTLSVGPCQFRLHVPPLTAEEAAALAREPLRLQAAAVAAQQAALAEEEAKLVQRRAALEKQEEQLAAHLEEKRVKLLQISESAQVERAALETERTAYEQQIEKVTASLTDEQKELLAGQQKMEAERKRLAELHRRIRQRWHRFWLAERRKYDLWKEALTTEAQALTDQSRRMQACEQALTEKRLRIHALYELGRCQLRDAWQRLRQDQFRWKHRRGKERAALRVRRTDIEAAEMRLAEARRLLVKDKRAWDHAKDSLRGEIDGMETRVRNQRQRIVAQQHELARLDGEIGVRLPYRANVPDAYSIGEAHTLLAGETASLVPVSAATQETWERRLDDTERLTGALADQRLQLVEQWHRLVTLRDNWEQDRRQASLELEELARRLVDNGHLLARREENGLQAEQTLRQRHDELVQARQQMIAWRTRLRVREKAWEAERRQLLAEVEGREKLADQNFASLVDLRQRWAARRRDELETLRVEGAALEAIRKANGQQRLVLVDQAAALEAEKRVLAEKAIALEQYRKEFLAKENDPAGERRLERLRRRWVTLNAASIRAATRERDSLKATLETLEARATELHARAEFVARSETELSQKQASWEHKQTLAAARQARFEQDLKNADMRRKVSEQLVAHMKDEIERIARALIDQPDPPKSEALQQAA